jgi:hypothetical protein
VLQGGRVEAWRAVRFCAALLPVVHEGANGGSQQGEFSDAIRRRLHSLLPRFSVAAGTEQGSQMQALAQLCEDQTHTEWSQGSPCRLASRVRYRPSSSNLFQRRNRFIHARHTAARAKSKIEGGAGGEGQISRLGLGTAGGDGLRGGSREVAMFAAGEMSTTTRCRARAVMRAAGGKDENFGLGHAHARAQMAGTSRVLVGE